MAKAPCPDCGSPHAQSLDKLLASDNVEYLLCARCGYVWTVAKDGSGRIEHVTAAMSHASKRHAGR